MFTSVCRNLTTVNKKARKKKKGHVHFKKKKKLDLVWQGLSPQCFLQKQSMILRKVLFTLIDD